MKNTYESIINKLRNTRPKADKPADLTSKIIRSLDKSGKRNQPHISLSLNETQWNVFTILRTAMAAATLVLAGYFVYQQWEIKVKLGTLESKMNVSVNIEQVRYNKTSRKFKFQQLYETHFASMSTSNTENEGAILINQKTLNFFLSTIRELEQENAGYRNRFRNLMVDTAKNNQSFQIFK